MIRSVWSTNLVGQAVVLLAGLSVGVGAQYVCQDGSPAPTSCTVDSECTQFNNNNQQFICEHKTQNQPPNQQPTGGCCLTSFVQRSSSNENESDSEKCRNRRSRHYCESHKRDCIDSERFDDMVRDCKKTCNRCKKRCRDLGHECPERLRQGYCNLAAYADVMVWQCPRSCFGNCKNLPTPRQTRGSSSSSSSSDSDNPSTNPINPANPTNPVTN